ncbi:MAG: hypothetical protein P4L51_16475 [Puia sp.]|nr:hypothetical protein [Puia sp.]
MKKNNMQHDTHKAKIYKDIYRPSTNPGRFLRTLLSVILMGQSPVGSGSYLHPKKSK